MIGDQAEAPGLDAVCELRTFSLDDKYNGICSATLIDANHLLTAAHCEPPNILTATAFCKLGKVERLVLGWVHHPDYPQWFIDRATPPAEISPALFQKDVAVLLLAPEIPATEIKPIPPALSSAEIEATQGIQKTCLLVGFSPLDKTWLEKKIHRKWLAYQPGERRRQTPWQPLDASNQVPSVEKAWKDVSRFFAASGPERRITHGDSGGPLVCPDGKGHWKVVAVHESEWPIDELIDKTPNVSVSSWTTNYADWLRKASTGPMPRVPRDMGTF